MPTLDWMGKDKVVNHYREVPYRVLERDPEKSVPDSHGSDCGNMIVHGDNLEALKALLPEYEGKVDCIYIDPPYNTGNEGWVYNDNVNDPRIKRWIGQVVGKEGEDLSRHDKWLCMMYPRLQLLRKMLSPSGAIFISIDDNEADYLRLVCDEIFGSSCFVANVSWQRTYSTRNDSKGIVNEVEHLLVYSKQPGWVPAKLPRTAEMNSKYKNPDGDFALWRNSDAFAPGAATHQGMVYAIQHPFSGEMIYPTKGSCWRYGQDQMLEYMNGWCDYELRELDDLERRAEVCGVDLEEKHKNVKAIVLSKPLEESRKQAQEVYEKGPWPRFFFTKGGKGGIARKTYLDAVEGKLPTNLWLYDDVGHTDEAAKELKEMFGGNLVFQTPKPSRLVRRVLEIGCPKDGLVLDAFGGSGTTAQAVLQENEINNANRRFILIEMGDYADSITAERARRVIEGYSVTKNRKERIYEKKLTAGNLKRFSEFYDEAIAVKEVAVSKDVYNKVEGPKMDGEAIIVEGVTNRGERVPGIDSGFSYFDLGPALFTADGTLDTSVPREDLKRYVWYTETKADFTDHGDNEPYLLGELSGTVYYLVWEPDRETVLDYALLGTLPQRGQTTVVYADRCGLAPEQLEETGVVFKQIPRQIARF